MKEKTDFNLLNILKKQIDKAKIENNGINYDDYYAIIGHENYHNSIKYNLCSPFENKKDFDYELERKNINLYGIKTLVSENFEGVELVRRNKWKRS